MFNYFVYNEIKLIQSFVPFKFINLESLLTKFPIFN